MQSSSAGSSVDPSSQLPDYAGPLLAYHRSHARTFQALVNDLPIQQGSRWLDLATGDGTYATLMAAKGARVTAVDADSRFLELARRRSEDTNIDFVRGDAEHLTLESGSYAGAFCAQSFQSIENVDAVLSEMKRVVEPGGVVAVMENDSLHHVILPLPPELELELRWAQFQAVSQQKQGQERFYLGRQLAPRLNAIGLVDISQKSYATQLVSPLSDDARCFLQHHLEEIVSGASPFLSKSAGSRLAKLADPSSRCHLLDEPQFGATVVDLMVYGRLPGHA